MTFPPSPEIIEDMVRRIRAEADIRKKWPYWSGGTIILERFKCGATLRPDGTFEKIFFQDGESREYFTVEKE